MSDVLALSAAQAAQRVRAGDLAPGELWDAYRERAAAEDLNAFLWLAEDAPEAPAADAPLGGVPFAAKDLFCVRGVPSQAGSRIIEGYRPPYTATVVEQILAAGAPLLGKTNQDEFAMGSSNEHSGYGPVLNPWDRARVPGGSSGGSAAAVAAGLVPWAIGTDTGGSIRQPACLSGIVGLKPTYGACSRYGMIAFASSLDQAGPLTRDVTDAALLFSAMVGRDPCDATSLEFPEEVRLPTAERLDGLRLGFPEDLTGAAEGMEPGVLENFRATLARAEELGAHVEPCRLPHAQHGIAAYYLITSAEASSNLARFDGVRYGRRIDGEDGLLAMYERTRGEGFGDEVKRRIMLGTYALSAGYYDAYYGRAQKVRTKIADDFRAAFETLDFVVTPTSPWVAFPIGTKTDDPLAMYLNDFFTVPMPLAGIPAISIPDGLSEGLPTGFQIVGPAFSENRILDAAYALEQAIGFDGSAVTGVSWEPVIGLEIHVQLTETRTKMFCGCEPSFGDEPNTHTCPVCLGLPGALPVANERAIEFALKIGLALGCDLAPRSIFHRKNYFYPDNPKAYQISQYDEPLCRGGHLGDVRIHRVHLEEDAAKLIHRGRSGRIHGADTSVVDFNRCGTPLVEIVSEPDIHSPEQAREWLILLRETVRQLGVSDVNMEEGSLRADANVSVRPAGTSELGTKTELKNMNSFRFVERGIRAEIVRQTGLLEDGQGVVQETLHFDPQSDTLTPLRSKEEAHDYRYFPEPDLVPVEVTEAMIEAARAGLPELPADREERYRSELSLSDENARVLAFRPQLGAYFEAVLASADGAEAQVVANWARELATRLGDGDPAESKVEPGALARLVALVAEKAVTHDAAGQVLDRLIEGGGDPEAIVAAEDLGALGGGDELAPVVQAAIEANPEAANQVRAGKEQAMGPIIGHVMRETKGRADGGEVRRLILEQLG